MNVVKYELVTQLLKMPGPGNRTQATLVEGERSHHWDIPAPQNVLRI